MFLYGNMKHQQLRHCPTLASLLTPIAFPPMNHLSFRLRFPRTSLLHHSVRFFKNFLNAPISLYGASKLVALKLSISCSFSLIFWGQEVSPKFTMSTNPLIYCQKLRVVNLWWGFGLRFDLGESLLIVLKTLIEQSASCLSYYQSPTFLQFPPIALR